MAAGKTTFTKPVPDWYPSNPGPVTRSVPCPGKCKMAGKQHTAVGLRKAQQRGVAASGVEVDNYRLGLLAGGILRNQFDRTTVGLYCPSRRRVLRRRKPPVFHACRIAMTGTDFVRRGLGTSMQQVACAFAQSEAIDLQRFNGGLLTRQRDVQEG